jgi:hypothetical protein
MHCHDFFLFVVKRAKKLHCDGWMIYWMDDFSSSLFTPLLYGIQNQISGGCKMIKINK